MGQHWQIINIDKRENLGDWGDLDEFFATPNRSADLISLLADPSGWAGCRIMCIGNDMKKCPPGVLTSKELAEIEKLPNTWYGKTLYTLAAGYFREARPWPHRNSSGTVLRNLTKGIYVRGDVVMEDLWLWTGHLSNVLLANICWSDSSSCEMAVDVRRGAWVGDRLDVVPLSVVKNDEDNWEDVTEDQVKFTRFVLSLTM
ncbi:hypothetical protein EDD18DRAFT_1196941 [Armillaria luteobubalina]|uniref:Uncharacterized protein n=1 Tax=Armillaria luteobubalina TaxID=153913 RepID=A0AA39PJD7_9AGAR|nr:hypothetical protein EDD18DRAFT_1196941 [Armillaria luteobubalina]